MKLAFIIEPDGQLIAALPKQPDVVASVFATDVGVDNDALQLPPNALEYLSPRPRVAYFFEPLAA